MQCTRTSCITFYFTIIWTSISCANLKCLIMQRTSFVIWRMSGRTFNIILTYSQWVTVIRYTQYKLELVLKPWKVSNKMVRLFKNEVNYISHYRSWYTTWYECKDPNVHSYGVTNMCSSHGRVASWRKWRACDIGEAKEGLENDLWRSWSNGRVGEWVVT